MMSMEEHNKPGIPLKQGDVRLLQEPIAQQLLQAKGPAHLAYNWRDGTPRVTPMGFHWNGQEIVMATAAEAPKTKVLTNGSKVALRLAVVHVGTAAILVAGLSLIVGQWGGVYWLVLTVLIYTLWSLNNAWLLVEHSGNLWFRKDPVACTHTAPVGQHACAGSAR
ncbi:MAG TPA: pyridoxamine 5'-phosphate oxidase family protein [Ktedonobacteraceae bacterium]